MQSHIGSVVLWLASTLRGWVQSSSELLCELWWKCTTSAELLIIHLWCLYMYETWSCHTYSYAFGFILKTGCDNKATWFYIHDSMMTNAHSKAKGATDNSMITHSATSKGAAWFFPCVLSCQTRRMCGSLALLIVLVAPRHLVPLRVTCTN